MKSKTGNRDQSIRMANRRATAAAYGAKEAIRISEKTGERLSFQGQEHARLKARVEFLERWSIAFQVRSLLRKLGVIEEVKSEMVDGS